MTPSFAGRCLRLAPAAFAVWLCSILAVPAFAQGEPTKTFDIPAGHASESLKQFMAQSGSELLFSDEGVATVQTNAVKSDLTPRAPLNQMLAGTQLVATQGKNNKRFAVQ